MALHVPTFLTRTGSAIIFGIIMLAGLLWNEWAFLVLAALIQVLCIREYFKLIPLIEPDRFRPGWLQAAVQVTGIAWLLFTFWGHESDISYVPALCCLPITIMLIASLHKNNGFESALEALGGLLYISLPVVLLTALRLHSILLPIGLILMIWTNDTMAYVVGSFIGKTPFSPISPKKTWEGTAGGALLTVIGAAVYGYCSPHYHMFDWIALALCAAIAGTLGDLLESKLKRMANVKDSGAIMPGHGGALDRFDSLLVATPFAYAYAYLFMPALPITIF